MGSGLGTIHGAFLASVGTHGDRAALRWRRDGRTASMSYAELARWVEAAAAWLSAEGVRRGDVVGILSRNRPQWAIADLAVLSLGGRVVPLYHTLPAGYLQYMMNDCGMKMLVVGDSDLMAAMSSAGGSVPTLESTVLLDDDVLRDGPDAFSAGRAPGRVEDVDPDEVATIVYTSGTTGAPKGVMLTHANIVANARGLIDRYGITAEDSIVSYLPLSHMFERTCGYYVFVFSGSTISYAEDMPSVQEAVLEARPTVLIAVPRVLEKAHAGARERIEGDSRLRKALVLDAVRTLNERANRLYRGEPVSPLLSLRCAFLDRLVASRFRAAAGGRLRLVVSGGASLDRQVAKVMFVVGFNVVEGYGMTEASPVIACNPIEGIRIGTVGTPLPGVEVRIGPSEEILVRGPNVMKGYYNRPEETAEALDADGWLHTGDQGALDEDGYLSITGRLKDLIVTSYGKNISPRPIEERIAKSDYIAQVMVYGDNRKHLVALVVPDEEALVRYARDGVIPFTDYRELVLRDETRDLIAREIERANRDAPSFEQVRGFDVLPEPFTLENGMLTPTLKPRRGRISMIHEKVIEGIYSGLEKPGGA